MALTLSQAVSDFSRRTGPRLMAGALAGAALARTTRGRPRRDDALVVGAVVALEPFTEWLIHRFILHAPVRQIGGHTIDVGAGHRRHHVDPDDLDVALVPTAQVVAFAAMIGAQVATVARVVRRGRGDAASTLAGLTVAYFALLRYEWDHYLIHTSYRPRTAHFRRLRARHRLHHWRNEHYWLGVTSNLADRVLGTLPDKPNQVPVSETARRLAA